MIEHHKIQPLPGVNCADRAHPNHGHVHGAHHPKVHPTMGHSHAHHHAPFSPLAHLHGHASKPGLSGRSPSPFSPLGRTGSRKHGIIKPRLTPGAMEIKPLKAHKTRHVHHHRHKHLRLPPCSSLR